MRRQGAGVKEGRESREKTKGEGPSRGAELLSHSKCWGLWRSRVTAANRQAPYTQNSWKREIEMYTA